MHLALGWMTPLAFLGSQPAEGTVGILSLHNHISQFLLSVWSIPTTKTFSLNSPTVSYRIFALQLRIVLFWSLKEMHSKAGILLCEEGFHGAERESESRHCNGAFSHLTYFPFFEIISFGILFISFPTSHSIFTYKSWWLRWRCKSEYDRNVVWSVYSLSSKKQVFLF